MEKRKSLEEDKKELLKRLEMASVSQQWTLHELRSMNAIVNQMLVQLNNGTNNEKMNSADNQDLSTHEKEQLSKDLKNVQCRIDELLALHEEDFNEEDQGVLIYDEVDEGSEHKEYLNKKIISLVKEKNLLAYKLKQILGENSEMNSRLNEVEVVIGNAIDLKKENEMLIEEYQKFKIIKEDEMSEVDDLFKFFKETLAENESLKTENENLAKQLNNPSDDEEEIDVEEVKKENLKLMFEKVQLEEKVNQQKQALLDMDEKLESNLNGKSESDILPNEDISVFRIKDSNALNDAKDNGEGKDFEEMYEILKVDYLTKEEELEANKKLMEELQKVVLIMILYYNLK